MKTNSYDQVREMLPSVVAQLWQILATENSNQDITSVQIAPDVHGCTRVTVTQKSRYFLNERI